VDPSDAAEELARGQHALAGVLRDLVREQGRAAEAYSAVVASLTAALEARDGFTAEQTRTVRDLCDAVGRRLGVRGAARAELRTVAQLHDIGKIGVPDHVLHKPGALEPAEQELVRRHPVVGERILRPLGGPAWSSVADAVRHEHEHWDGTGYPDGLRSTAIPLAARVVLVCDTYVTLTVDRPYRPALDPIAARAEVAAGAGTRYDPRVVDALLAVLAAGGVPAADPDDDDEDAARPLAGDERPGRELRALVAITAAGAATDRIEDVVAVVAAEARGALGAASVVVARREDSGAAAALRTLHTAGRPAGGDGDATLVAPIAFGGGQWGELRATRPPGEEFGPRDAPFLATAAAQLATALGRVELLERLSELAYRDTLTGLANRRALEERLEALVPDAQAAGRPLAVLICDVDNLKELNDGSGHATGDAALVRVAKVLRQAIAGRAGLACRLSGDEFCVLLENGGADAARIVAEAAIARLGNSGSPAVGLSVGVAALDGSVTRPADLLRAADAALYTAKRTGRGRVCVAEQRPERAWRPGAGAAAARRGERRRLRDESRGAADTDALVAAAMASLDGPLGGADALVRLDGVLGAAAVALDLAATAVSFVPTGGDALRTVLAVDLRAGTISGERLGSAAEEYAVDAFPATAALLERGGALVVERDDPAADPAEVAVLAEFGLDAVLAVALAGTDGTWLLELYADDGTAALAPVAPVVRLLAGEAVGGAGRRCYR